jgi:RNA polymerase sigma-70 factor (ECF subfamily)
MTSVRSGPDPLHRAEPSHRQGAVGRGDAQAGDSVESKSASRNVNTSGEGASNLEARRAEAEEDRVLIEAAQNGDSRAFRKLVERHQRRAFAIAFAMVRDENDAKDIVQEAFVRVYRGLDGFEGGSRFFTWFYRILTNLAIDLKRKPGRREVEHDDNRLAPGAAEEADFPFISRIDGGEPLDVVQRRELGERLNAALEALPPYHRGVVLMREVEGMSYEEMAVAMNVSKGTIMSRLFHARQKLQRALEDYYRGNGDAPKVGAKRTAKEEP